MSTVSKYLTFPIEFLADAFTDIRKVCDCIFDYAIYVQSLKYEAESESEIEAVEKAARFFEIELGNVKAAFNNGYNLFEEYGARVAKASIRKEIIFDYYRSRKNEAEIAAFCAFCATKSIIGVKSYCKTNKFLIHARMFGHNTVSKTTFKSLLEEKYFKRYNFDKLIKELQYNWGMNMISNRCRGFYISYDIGLEELAIISEKAKQKSRDLQLKLAKDDAIKKAIAAVQENKTKQPD
ncbi:MAG: hypothetical protein LBD45_01090 [Bacteroidales bacterium]|jgi:hypothetical protein|nr:hypothetical protein [Bacteroidales bacterium]